MPKNITKQGSQDIKEAHLIGVPVNGIFAKKFVSNIINKPIKIQKSLKKQIKMKPKVDKLIKGDCLEVMKKWDNAIIDHCIIDPPYNMSKAN